MTLLNKFKIWLDFLGFPNKHECLVRKVDIDNIYSDMIVAQSWLLPNDRPDDEITQKIYMTTLPRWNWFLSSMHEGDELWYYRFPNEMWQKLRGSHGYLILRDDNYYRYFEIAKN